MTPSPTLHLVFVSGSLSPSSRTDKIAQWCARRCAEQGAMVTVFRGKDLDFPFYRTERLERDDKQRRYLAAMADSDGVVLISPAYHGTVSGLLKNALDYVNDLAGTDLGQQPFLDGRAIGCVAVSLGDQAATTTLATLRIVGHALRGWPTPLGVAISGSRASLGPDGGPVDPGIREQLQVMLGQVLDLAEMSATRRERVADPVATAV